MISISFGTPWQITFIIALAGVLVGGLITFIITYARARTEMKWELKREAYKAIIEDVDQAITNEGKAIKEAKIKRRRATHLIRLAYGQQSNITSIVNQILELLNNPPEKNALVQVNEKVDNELMPQVEADLEKR